MRYRRQFNEAFSADRVLACAIKLWSNDGPRIGTKRDFMRFSEPPASRIFNQLLVDRVLSQ